MRLLLILLFPALCFAAPIDEMLANNTALAASLEGHYNSSFAQNGSLPATFGAYSQSLDNSVSVEIAGLTASLDGASCASDSLAAVFARGYSMDHLIALPSEGYPDFECNLNWFQQGAESAWRCDFDTDSCVEFENKSAVIYDMNVTFAFRNSTYSVPFGSTLVPLPAELLEELGTASGAEPLGVSVNGSAVFMYEMNDRDEAMGCGSNAVNFSHSIPYNTSRTFIVGGGRKLFFLRAPVLREQWFRNNRFDMVVLSQCPLESAEFLLNGNITANKTLRQYEYATDSFGIVSLVSNLSAPDGWSEDSNLTAPTPLSMENLSFRYVYQLNHSYSALGENNLSLLITDAFGSSAQYNETILSRMLSFNGSIAEDGSPASPATARPSAPAQGESLGHFQLALGLVAFILILAFVNSWLLD